MQWVIDEQRRLCKWLIFFSSLVVPEIVDSWKLNEQLRFPFIFNTKKNP